MKRPLLTLMVPTMNARRDFWAFTAWNIAQQLPSNAPCEVLIAAESSGLAGFVRDHLKFAYPALNSFVEIATVYADATSTIGEKRNLLLMYARGEYLAWVDDDDWHPRWHRPWLNGSKMPATWSTSVGVRFIWLGNYPHANDEMRTWVPHPKMQHPIPQLVVGRADILRNVTFPAQNQGEDTIWFQRLKASSPGIIHAHVPGDEPIVALTHRFNTRPKHESIPENIHHEHFSMTVKAWFEKHRTPEMWSLLGELTALRDRLFWVTDGGSDP